jgi:orotidine-5'-phosphate decarboxylase
MSANIREAVVSPVSAAMRERLIVALDVPSAQAARQLVSSIGEAAGYYKVGLQLFTSEGPGLVRELVGSGLRIFLDLKFHDIPNTVGHAVKSAADLGVSMLTVHASAGGDVLRAAVEAAGRRVAIVGVTVLTSFGDEDLVEIGVPRTTPDQVLQLAALAHQIGCDGVVTSPRETPLVRRSLGQSLMIVNPGIRPGGIGKDDQERTATPGEAVRAGASHIVVGRPITQAKDPASAAHNIVLEMEQARSSGLT